MKLNSVTGIVSKNWLRWFARFNAGSKMCADLTPV
jgi:hypothetical protein